MNLMPPNHVRQQSRLFAPPNPPLKRSPNSNRIAS
jgi:hypothetical protein